MLMFCEIQKYPWKSIHRTHNAVSVPSLFDQCTECFCSTHACQRNCNQYSASNHQHPQAYLQLWLYPCFPAGWLVLVTIQ